MRVNEDSGGRMKNPDQILARGGIDRGLPPNRGIDHGDQSGGYLEDGNPTHERGGDEASEIPDHTAAERDHGGVPAEPLREHLIGQARPGFARLVGLSSGNGEYVQSARLELALDLAGVQGLDVRVGYERIPMRTCSFAREYPDLVQQAGCDGDERSAESNLTERSGLWRPGGARLSAAYQVTSPAPVRTFATRASIKSRSESRFR